MSAAAHTPVLCEETIQLVIGAVQHESTTDARGSAVYVDATFGRGGHCRALLGQLEESAIVIAIDRDPAAIDAAMELASTDRRLHVHRARFSELPDVLRDEGISSVRGIVMDLGVSSPQLDDPERGFSFRAGGPIDMRMDPDSGESAGDWLNRAEEREIARVIFTYGEERFANRIAGAIVRARPLADTRVLADVIRGAIPRRPGRGEKRSDDATRSFQAIRMHVNEELAEVEAGIDVAFASLEAGGRLAVISFHSLEDRAVKRAFRALASGPKLPRGIPVRAAEVAPAARLVGGPIRAGVRELEVNPRARSATLRVLERLT